MNRIVLIGNGFDLAHNLKTSYQDFINWYWEKRVEGFFEIRSKVSKDILCTFTMLENGVWSLFAYNHLSPLSKPSGSEIIQSIIDNKDAFNVKKSDFFDGITRSIETNGWVDIENEYYKLLKQYALNNQDDKAHHLNEELKYIQDLLVNYLSSVNQNPIEIKETIRKKIFEPISQKDVSIESKEIIMDNCNFLLKQEPNIWREKLYGYGISDNLIQSYIYDVESYEKSPDKTITPMLFRFPDKILFLNFNYTHTAHNYIPDEHQKFIYNQIHGQLEHSETVIFGYGDEMDEQFKLIQNLNKEEYLKNIKSINYMNSSNYRNVLSFIESAPFQIYIMGHSCGNSDRTLLNTLFEHKNCISIKPFYYVKKDGSDNYIELVQNISRNFTDMKLMRDRVVNKTYCEPIV